MSKEWNEIRLEDALSYVQPGNFIVNSTEYNDSYKTPVLTPGKSFLLGFTDETDGIYDNLPTIIFDDFTTDFKYVDFPFKVKSSAMKMLELQSNKYDIRFLYYLMKTLNFNASEHKRYWISKYSKQKVKVPLLAEQKQIAAILDAADSLRQKDQQLVEHYTQLSQSLFLEMFGDPVTNPMGWDKAKLETIVNTVIDCPHSTPQWSETGKVAIRTSNLTAGGWNWNDKRFVSDDEYHERSKRAYVKAGDIVLSREGTIGIAAIVEKGMDICLGQRLVQLIPNLDIANNRYLLSLLLYELSPKIISRVMVGATSKHLNVKELRGLKMIVPPIALQNQFSERIEKIEQQKQQAQANLDKSNDLFNALLQKAFTGELTANKAA